MMRWNAGIGIVGDTAAMGGQCIRKIGRQMDPSLDIISSFLLCKMHVAKMVMVWMIMIKVMVKDARWCFSFYFIHSSFMNHLAWLEKASYMHTSITHLHFNWTTGEEKIRFKKNLKPILFHISGVNSWSYNKTILFTLVQDYHTVTAVMKFLYKRNIHRV